MEPDPPLKPKPAPGGALSAGASASGGPHKRDSARVLPGGGRGDHSTFQSTFQTRDSEAGECVPPRSVATRVAKWWLGVRRRYAFWGRYSVGKLQAFSDYQRAHSLPRTLLVLASAPLPSIAVLLALLAVPLASPTLGPSHNGAAFARSAVSHIGASFCITLVVKQALEFSDRVYPYWRCLLLACLASGTNEALWTGLAFAWRFPIPFRELLCAHTWFVWFVLAHYATMRHHFAPKKRRMRIYAPVFTVQFGMFYVFLALAVAFTYAGLVGQVAIVLVVPPLKVGVKRLFWRLTKQLDDLSTDVTVCVVEISAAMYQCLVMQYAASPLIPVLFFVADVAQAAGEIALFVDHGFLVRGETAFAVAVDIIAHARALETKRLTQQQDERVANGALPPPSLGARSSSIKAVVEGGKRSVASMATPVVATPEGSTRRQSSGIIKAAAADAGSSRGSCCHTQFLDFRPPAAMVAPSEGAATVSSHVVDGLPIPRATDARLLTQLLRLLFATEMLLFVEFIEVVLALLYVVVFGLASVLPGGAYVVSLMDLSDTEFSHAMANAGLYLALEVGSFALAFWLLRRQCGLSTLFQIAYVLEQYWMTIQGKVVCCLLLLLNLATAHQGTDFTFQFHSYP